MKSDVGSVILHSMFSKPDKTLHELAILRECGQEHNKLTVVIDHLIKDKKELQTK